VSPVDSSTRSALISGVPGPPETDVPISQLPLAAILDGSEWVVLVQNGITVRAPASMLGAVGAAPAFTSKINSLYYQTTGQQEAFPLSTPDLFGNSYNLGSGPAVSLEVTAGGLRLTPGPDYLINYTGNSVTLTAPAGPGMVVVIDIYAKVPGQGITVEPVTVTGLNAFQNLTHPPDGAILIMFVNHQAFFSIGSPPSFMVVGTAISWFDANVSVSPGDRVVAFYTHA